MHLMNLFEKGYEQRSDRGFRRVGRQNGPKSSVSVLRKATQQAPPTLFGQFLQALWCMREGTVLRVSASLK